MDFIDIPDLQRRGLIKKQIESDCNEISDYTSQNTETSSITPSTTPDVSNPLSFLDNLATTNLDSSQESPTSLPPPDNSVSPTDLMDLKIKLDNFEYKIDRFTDKLTMIESKLKKFEDKVS